MTRLLYHLVFPLALVLILPFYLARMFRRGDYRRDFGQRFALYPPDLREKFSRGEWIWVHAVSVGELLVALKLLAELHRRHPAWKFAVSSTTSTAHALALSHREDWWVPVYTPVDFAPVVRRALEAVRPKAIVLTESEMWPGFVWSAAARGIPVVLVNARVSPRSEKRYRRFAPLLRAVTRHLHAVGLQEPGHAALWQHLGVPRERLHLTGSVKFDPAETPPARDLRDVLRSFGIADGQPVVLGGSTHEGEEEILAGALTKLRGPHPQTRLLLAPRHVERASEIVAKLTARGWRVARRSASPDGNTPDILVIDTTGELRDWYGCADAVFIGKSLTGRGGQNPVEAVLAGCPVVFGPHMENFAALRDELLRVDGALEVKDPAGLSAALSRLLASPEERRTLAARAAQALDPHRGATSRTADLVEAALIGE